MKVEICVDNIEDIKICNNYNDVIKRVELNQALGLGGLTPSISLVKKTRKILDKNIKLVCMIRYRAGDFNYTLDEYEIMLNEAKEIIKYCDGIVFGALTKDGLVDYEKTEKMVKLCHDNNKQFVFHRAIDISSDYFKDLKTLEKLNVDRVLTSGHKENAVEGLENIKNINSNIEVLVGCGINPENIHLFNNFEVHGSFSKNVYTKFGNIQRVDEEKLKKLRIKN